MVAAFADVVAGTFNGFTADGAHITANGSVATTSMLFILEAVALGFVLRYPAYKSGQLNISELARVCDLSRTTIYKYIDLLEG